MTNREISNNALEHIPGLTRAQIESAWHGTSFSPEKRAARVIEGYHGDLAEFKRQLAPLAETSEQQDLLDSLSTSYAQGLAKKYCTWIAAHGRCLSPMITGPANFPTHRNEKANNAERRRFDELVEWDSKALSRATKNLLNARSPQQVFNDEWHQLKQRIARDMGNVLGVEQGGLRYDKASFKTSMAGRLRRLALHGKVELVAKALDFIEQHQKRFKHPVFTKRHSIWKLGALAEEALAKTKATSIKEDQELGRYVSVNDAERLECTIVAAHADDRLRLLFGSKPPADIRSILKRSGWRWSPSVKCWQRKLTQNALYNISFITREAGLEKVQQTDSVGVTGDE